MTKKLLLPEDIRAAVARKYDAQHRAWFAGEGEWPLVLGLGVPTEADARQDATAVRRWVSAWQNECEASPLSEGSSAELRSPRFHAVGWSLRQWPRMGPQRLPAYVSLPDAASAVRLLGKAAAFGRARLRHDALLAEFDAFRQGSAVRRQFDELAAWDDSDFQRLLSLLRWLQANPSSGLYLRQLPVASLDTKWVEQRRGLVVELAGALLGRADRRALTDVLGLEKTPHRARVRILCPRLRQRTGGLRDIEAPLTELAALDVTPRRLVVVENLETGVALPDLEGTVAFMKLGHGVSVLADIPWARELPGVYWGDIDTHGFAILDKARGALPGLCSVLMDEPTLLANQARWGTEPAPYRSEALERLTATERKTYEGLRDHRWQTNLRLEQERLPWEPSMEALRQALTRG